MLLQIESKGLHNAFHLAFMLFAKGFLGHFVPLQKEQRQTKDRILLSGYIIIDHIHKITVGITASFLINIHGGKRTLRNIKKSVSHTDIDSRVFQQKNLCLSRILIHFAQNNFAFARFQTFPNTKAHALISAAFTSQIHLNLRIGKYGCDRSAMQNNLPISETLHAGKGCLLFPCFLQAFCRNFCLMH